MRIKRFLAICIALSMLFAFSGCRNKDNDLNSSQPDVMNENELVIYHNADELTPYLTSLANAYSQATGNPVTVKLSANDFMNEVYNENAAIYVVDSHEDLSDWFGKGLFGDLSAGIDAAADIPSGLHLNNTGLGSYGIPFMLEGYGYIVDRTMLSDLFGGASAEAIVRDLAACSYTEFEGFVDAVNTYIAAPSAATVTINGSEYTFAAEKTGRAQSLTGVFSLNYDSARASEYLLNYMLGAKFGSHYEIMNAGEEEVGGLNDVFSAYIDVLNLHTTHIAGTEGTIARGDEFIGGDYDYSASVDAFTGGYALFYPGSTGDAADFETSSAGFGSDLDIIPMKLPLADEDITAAGMTAEKLQSSIVIGSRYYIVFNPNAGEAMAAAARDFVNWIYSDTEGMDAYSSAIGGLPFNYSYGATGENAAGENGTENGANGNSAGENGAENGANGNSAGENSAANGANGNAVGENGAANGTNGNSAGESGTANGNANNPASGESAGENPAEGDINGDAGNNAPGANGENPGAAGTAAAAPNYNITDSLTAAVARYYAAGNWIPAMTGALPGGWLEDVFGAGLTDYWGMESWSTEDRTGLVEKFVSGWRDRLNRNDTITE